MGTVAGIAAAVGVVTGISSARQQRKAAKARRRAEERAAKFQNKQQALRRRTETRQRLAEARIQRAQIISAGFERGATGSSIVSGAVGALESDTSARIGQAGAQLSLEQSRIGALGQAADAQTAGIMAATTFGSISQASSLFTDVQSNRAVAKSFGF